MANSGQHSEQVDTSLENVENLRDNQMVEEIIADSQRNQAYLSVEQNIATESQNLANSVNGNESLEQQQLAKDVDTLLGKYKNLAKGINSAEGSLKTKRALLHRLNENIESLKRIKKDIGKYNYDNLATYKTRVSELTYYFEHYEQVRQMVVLGGRTSDIHAIIDSKQDARYARRQENQDARYQSSMNDILHEAALTSLWNNDMERYEEYLEAVLNGQVEPSSHPFYAAHKQSFALIQATSPDLYGAIAPCNRRGQIPYEVYCQQNGVPCRPNGLDPNRRYRTGSIGDDIASMIEDQQIRRGKEVNPAQREARRKIGSIGSIVGCVALGVGILREIFHGKERKTNWGRVLGFGAGIFGITHYREVKDTVFDAFNLDPDSHVARRQNERIAAQGQQVLGLSQTESQELADASIKYPTLVATTLGAIPINLLIEQRILEEKDGKLVLNKNNYAEYVENIAIANGRPDSDKQEMLDRISTDEAVNAISYGLTYCGIKNLNDLRSLKGSSEKATLMDSATFTNKFRTRVEAIRNQTGIFSKMADQGFIPVGLSETLKILEKYDSNKNENEQILERLKAGLLKADPDKEYSVADMLEDPYYKELMDLENMTMKGFRNGANEVKFTSYGELFETVYITEKIKYIFKGRTDALDVAPFHVNAIGQIEFNNREWYELHKTDTTVISLKKLKTDLPTIKNNVDAYNDYLNKWWLSQIGT